MGNKKIYIIAKVFDQPGCLAYLCQTPNEARCLPGTLEALRAEGVQIVILDSPEIYSEYAPYSYIEDMKEFIDRVSQLNRVHRIGEDSTKTRVDSLNRVLGERHSSILTCLLPQLGVELSEVLRAEVY